MKLLSYETKFVHQRAFATNLEYLSQIRAAALQDEHSVGVELMLVLEGSSEKLDHSCDLGDLDADFERVETVEVAVEMEQNFGQNDTISDRHRDHTYHTIDK